MAVAASSAFPGFFPPLELSGWDVGAPPGVFDRQAFTDGGVYDNLGLRMFRCIQDSWVRDSAPLQREDSFQDGFDAILVSDAGGKFKIASDGRGGGLIKTALRASDILMDRVWQLELETFENTPGVLFFPIMDVVSRAQDPTAPQPEIQRQAARIRTDLDRFSDLEISALVQHGYCVTRQTCRDAGFVDRELAPGPPWDPLRSAIADATNEGSNNAVCLQDASQMLSIGRRLQNSSVRRIWSTMFSSRDWPTYVWIPLLVTISLSLPYALYKLSDKARQQRMVLSAVAETSPIYRKVLQLLEQGPVRSFEPSPFEEVEALEVPDFTGYEVVSDTRIYDFRRWADTKHSLSAPFVHERVQIRRSQAASENTWLRFQLPTQDEKPFLACRTESLNPVVSRAGQADGTYVWEIGLDLSHVPLDSIFAVVMEGTVVSDLTEVNADGGHFSFTVPLETGLVQIWMLLPLGRQYDEFALSSYPVGKPQLAQVVVPETTVELPLGSIAMFRFINPPPAYRYECR